MHSEHRAGMSEATPSLLQEGIKRREFLRLGGAGLAGAALLGSFGSSAAAARPLGKSESSLATEFRSAADEYGVPASLLAAMGYVNTRWDMPPADANVYHKGDVHGWGSYGIMALVQNPFSDTLGKASSLTGLPEETLKTSRAANIRGGAALLAESLGDSQPSKLEGFYGAIAGNGEAPGKNYSAVSGVGAGELYAREILQTLASGVPEIEVGPGESMSLDARDVGPDFQGFESDYQASDYSFQSCSNPRPGEVWYPANRGNYTESNRGKAKINKIVVHCTQGSWIGAVRWFQDRRAKVSAHYVIRSRDGRIAQCVSDRNIAWHAGDWWWNRVSIGIEHEGYFNNRRWFTDRELNSSARLAAFLCHKYNIRPNRNNIVGHRHCSSTRCPGKFRWKFFMRRLHVHFRHRCG